MSRVVELFTAAKPCSDGSSNSKASATEVAAASIAAVNGYKINEIRVTKNAVYTLAGTKLASFTQKGDSIILKPKNKRNYLIRDSSGVVYLDRKNFTSSYIALCTFLKEHPKLVPIIIKGYDHYTYCVAIDMVGRSFIGFDSYIKVSYPLAIDPIKLVQEVISKAELLPEQAETIIDTVLSRIECAEDSKNGYHS